MGNSPSKDDPLPNISSNALNGSSSSGPLAPGDGEADDIPTGLSRATGNGSNLGSVNRTTRPSMDFPASTTSLGPKNIPVESRERKLRARSYLDLKHKYDFDIDASMALLLNNSLTNAGGKWKKQADGYSSSSDSHKSDHLSVSPVFTSSDGKDESLVLLLNSLANSPVLTKNGSLLSTPLELSLAPIHETSHESTPEPRRARAEHRKQATVDIERWASKRSASASQSPPLVPQNKKMDLNVDAIIENLMAAGNRKPSSPKSRKSRDKLPVTTQEIKLILAHARAIFMEQPVFLKLSPPVKIVGDIHGQFNDLLRIFNCCGYPPQTNYLFLGDYVDRGHKSLETILLLLCFKIKYPENFFMLRGNHESANITKIYGFYDECKRRLPSVSGSHKLWKNFVDVFNTLPIAATINDKIFCIHGGLSPELRDMKQIEQIQRPTDIPDKGLLADLLWSDPDPQVKSFSTLNWPKNDRGVSYCFGKRHVDHFLNTFNMDLIVRGHMVVEDGYEFFNKRKLVTVFLAPNYCGEFNNFGAIMSVDKSLCCSFELLKPQ